MKKIIMLIAIISIAKQLNAQDKFFTKTGKVDFDATTAASPEKIQLLPASLT
jgi:hypothetical protein